MARVDLDKETNWAIEAAYLEIAEEDRAVINEMAGELCRIRGLGWKTAVEILGKIGLEAVNYAQRARR